MDVATVGVLIAIVGCFVGLAGWLSGRDKKIANDSEWKGGVNSKLDSIQTGINGVCTDVKTIESCMTKHGERLSAVEASAKQAHHRIDRIEKGES